ncbi:MAG TPA: non-homologous end-joining DNA ligase [Verrucomicrobiae bacterium]|nr:non-homologous end-joining DNA ligase [Verrucomicrobiae bacterium]
MKQEQTTRIGATTLSLSNLDKVLYPAVEFTKGQVIDYYRRISDVLLPHLKDRPLTLKRYPEGVNGEFFYEKQCPAFRPKWIQVAPLWSRHKQQHISFCLVNDLASLVWVANLADLELHPSLARHQKPEQPTMMVFDLDPGPGTDILDCARVGLWLRDLLAKFKLKSFPKTSGSKGLQVYVPLNTKVTFDETKAFSHAVASIIAEAHPGQTVTKMAKSLRHGKVFIDWSQNDNHKTTVCVYSLRAREQPSVSTPLRWTEVERGLKSGKAGAFFFLTEDVLKRVKRSGDLFEPVLTMKQKLPKESLSNGN